jgi:hypothetical protein
MPTLTIGDRQVTVDDSFLQLSPERQNATVEEIAKSLPKKPSTGMDVFKSIASGAVAGPYDAMRAAASGPDAITDFILGKLGLSQDPKIKEALKPQPPTALQYEPQTTAGRYTQSAARAVTNPASYGGPGAAVPKIAAAVGGGLGAEAGGDLTHGSTVGQVAGGMLGAMAPSGLMSAARRINAPTPIKSPERAANVNVLNAEGIHPTAGDTSGRAGVRVAEEMGNRVLGGGSYSAIKEKPLQQLTAAVTERAGERTTNATPEYIERTRQRIGSELESVASKLPIKHDTRLTDDLTRLATEVTNNSWLSPELQRAVNRQIESILNGFTVRTIRGKPVGIMSGDAYQGITRFDTPLGRAMRSADSDTSHYANKIRSILDDALERSATGAKAPYLAALKEARKQWYNMLIISKSVAGPGEAAAEGTILPERLRAAMTAGTDNKMSYAAGKSDLHKLARAAAAVITPARQLDWAERAKIHGIPGAIGGAAGFLGGGAPGAALGSAAASAAPGLVGRAVNSRMGQAYLKRQPGGPAPDAAQWANALRGAAIGSRKQKRDKQYGGTAE